MWSDPTTCTVPVPSAPGLHIVFHGRVVQAPRHGPMETSCDAWWRRPGHHARHLGGPPTGSRELGDGTGRWRCCDCGVEKVAADFSFNAGGHVRSYCKACDAVKNREYRQTLRGNAGTLVRGARHRSKLKGWSCNLDTDFILDLILYQEGRCAYSGVQMENLLPHSDWRMSLERVNTTVGYVREKLCSYCC